MAILFSIAVSQILLGLALAALLLSGARLRLPPIWLQLSIFMAGTLLSLAFSGNAAAGLPQIRKFYVFLILLAIFSTLRDLVTIRRLFLVCAAAGVYSGVLALAQYLQKAHEARALGKDFYEYYISARITGAMSHWMTFGGEEMLVVLILGAFLFFAPRIRKRDIAIAVPCAAVLLGALILNSTRSIILVALPVAGLYLVWRWKPRALLILPVALLAGALLAPSDVRERFVSVFQPRQGIDSNRHRIICWRTGLRMMRAHPWLGLGPEMVGRQFYDYLPPDVRRPLPPGWYGHLHNIYIQYAAERGIPVMLVMLWMLFRIAADFLGAIRKLPPGRSDERFILQAGIAVVIATMLGGWFEYNLGDSEVLTLFLVVVACGYVAAENIPAKLSADRPAHQAPAAAPVLT